MKVGRINNIRFKSGQVQPIKTSAPNSSNVTNELLPVTPDFGVKTPVKYSSTGIYELNNGQKVYTYKLANGYKVSVIPMEGSPAIVKSYVNVGALNETPDIKGISHFLEHMAFNGTNGEEGHIKLEQGDSFKKIDELGGWANASTNYAVTDYVNSTPLLENKDVETQIKVIAAMAEDLKLSKEMIEKEKGPVSSEINMILDDPKTIAMDQTVRTLFNIKNPADELVGGSVEHIKNLTQKDVMDYYNTYYTPDNTNIVVSGDVNPDEIISLISKNFNSRKISQGKKYEEALKPIQNTIRKDFISDKAASAEIVLGFAGAKNTNTREKIIYDVLEEYLNSYSSGLEKNLKEYNSTPYISSEKIITNPSGQKLIYLAASAANEKCEDVLKTIFSTLSSKSIDNEELDKIKKRILRYREDMVEISLLMNTETGNSVLNGDLDYVTKYNEILESLTVEEVNDCYKKFFDLNKAAITVVHPQSDSKEISFKGNSSARKPVNTDKVSEHKLDNNFNIGLYKTNSNNITCDITLNTTEPYNKKIGAGAVLNEIYSMGMKNIPEEEFNKIKEDSNININANSGYNGIAISLDCRSQDFIKSYELSKKLLYNPNITDENIEKAKKNIKDRLIREQDDAYSLFKDYESKKNPYEYSKNDLLSSLDNITKDDIIECHRYILNNSRGIITANIPESDIENKLSDYILRSSQGLHKVHPNIYEPIEYYKKNETPAVLTKINKNSQADIIEAFTFESDFSVKETVSAEILNSILSNSSIGLFDILREKENLAYSVHSEISRTGNRGEICLNILTTTDNKENGEKSYDNIQKSINGFNRQINELKNGKFTDYDLENAKRSLKATLLYNEGRGSKLCNIESGLNSKYGIDYKNLLFEEIDKISKEDILELAQKIFSEKPVYAITATENSLNANKEFLESLKQA